MSTPEGLDFALDHQSGWRCPECGENKTSSWRDGPKLVLHCWRVSCGYNREVWVGDVPVRQAPEPVTVFDRPMRGVSGAARRWLKRSFRLDDTALSFGQWAEVCGEKAFWMPIFGPNREHRGGVYRRYDGRTPKALTYREAPGPLQCWYIRHRDAPTVVVEDPPSALRLWQHGRNAVALLGTALTGEKAQEIQNYTSGPIYLALDRDAFGKAIKYRKRYGEPWVPKLILRDVKDMTDGELREAFRG